MRTMHRQELVGLVTDWVRANSRETDWDPAALAEPTDLIASGILDSVGFLQLLAFLEHTTEREIDLSDIDPADFTTVGGLCTYALRTPSGEEAYVSVR